MCNKILCTHKFFTYLCTQDRKYKPMKKNRVIILF